MKKIMMVLAVAASVLAVSACKNAKKCAEGECTECKDKTECTNCQGECQKAAEEATKTLEEAAKEAAEGVKDAAEQAAVNAVEETAAKAAAAIKGE